ncbi:hypothetical protein NX801_26155 [Streptomyces sp. LP05-1]|uniref:Formyl transferase N-terminal domain-containing protein n=1 Tax=Streptomyces pyxinae TaxID=2970734 RepID=A0ABT2CR83_9ACTN|nr:formyltransferase family protein [Streptomyces sp. LP05-1]MCS0639064.1 hypothetical protein [Streptomyces sp. LP05-1]
MRYACVLLTESSFHASCLISQWLAAFPGSTASGSGSDAEEVCLRDTPDRLPLYRKRFAFHRQHGGLRRLSAAQWAELDALYGGLSDTERAMVRAFGVTPLPEVPESRVRLTGRRLNSPEARQWLEVRCHRAPPPFLCVFLDRLLAPWWIDLTGGRIVNAHSAVLPYARGMYATEQVAAEQDRDRFRQCAGATVHYIDNGVDTGPVIRAQHLRDPFAFDSLWECKAHCFDAAFHLLVTTAREVHDRPGRRAAAARLPR